MESKRTYFRKLCEELLRLRLQFLNHWIVCLWAQHSCLWEIWHKGLSGSQSTSTSPGPLSSISNTFPHTQLPEDTFGFSGSNLAIINRNVLEGNPFEVSPYFVAWSFNSGFLGFSRALLAVSSPIIRSSHFGGWGL